MQFTFFSFKADLENGWKSLSEITETLCEHLTATKGSIIEKNSNAVPET